MELTTKDWKEFRIGDLFEVLSSKKIYHAVNLDIKEIQEDGYYPYVVRSEQNRGIRGYIKKPNDDLNSQNTLSFAQDTFFAFYRDEPYFTGNNVKVLKPLFRPSKNRLLFLESVINKSVSTFSWGRGSSKESLKNIKLLLPSKNDEPDWDFMEEFIKEIEEKYILNVDKYNQENIDKALSVTGLTTADLNGNLEVKPADRYEEFRVGDLFEINSSKKIYHANQITIYDKQTEGAYPYIVRSENNRGIRGFIKESEDNLNDHMTLSFAQDTFVAYFQPFKYFTGNKVKILKPIYNINENMFLYLETAINKAIQSFSWGSGSTEDTIRDIKILLPAIDENTPDFDYMEKAIYIYILKRSLSLGKWITKKKSEL